MVYDRVLSREHIAEREIVEFLVRNQNSELQV